MTAEGRDAHLRASLEPGVYFLLVDEAEPFGVGGAFQLKVQATAPASPDQLRGAQSVSDGSLLVRRGAGPGHSSDRPVGAAKHRRPCFTGR